MKRSFPFLTWLLFIVSLSFCFAQNDSASTHERSKQAAAVATKHHLNIVTRSEFDNFDPIEYAKKNFPKEIMNGKDAAAKRAAWTKYVNEHPYSKVTAVGKAEIKSIPKYDRPDLAMMHDYLRMMEPALGYVPYDKLTLANTTVRQILQQKTAIAGLNWVERGPNNIGGRTRALMWDPNDITYKKVWAGSVGGGLWYNTDITSATSSWMKINDFWDNIAISCIAYDPSNTLVFYVGTGEGFGNGGAIRGNGIWKTTDGGLTWSQLSSTTGSNFYYVNDLCVTSTGVLFAATETGLSRSADGGSTWTTPTGTAGTYFDLEITASGTIIAAEDNGTLQRSTTSAGTAFGAAISPGTNGNRVEVACSPSNANIVYAVSADNTGNIAWFKKSSDGGATWPTNVTIPIYLDQSCTPSTDHYTRGQAWYDLILAVSPTDPNLLLAGGIDVHRSTNGGTSWTSVSYWTGFCGEYAHADQHAMAFRPTFPNQCLFGNDGGINYSNDVGNSGVATPVFSTRIKDYNVTQYYALALKNVSSDNYMLAGAQDNGSHKFTTTGINSIVEVTGGDGAFCHIDQDNPNYQITSYVYNDYYLSTDGGNSFNSLTSGTDGRFINPTDLDNNANILYCAENTNTLYRISNLNTTPTYSSGVSAGSIGTTPSAITASPYTANRIFVAGSNGSIFRIDNAHATPTATNIDVAATLPSGYIHCIALGDSDNHIIVTFSNFGGNKVYETLNGGTTWVNKTGNLPDMPIYWALIKPGTPSQVILATQIGVWSTDDITAGSVAWNTSNSGLANVRCEMLQIRNSDKLIGVATYGRGLFTSTVFQTPAAGFSANKQLAYLNSNVVFTDASNLATSWLWNFGSGASPATATGIGPHTVTYTTPGLKTISLTINSGASALTRTDYIQILPDKSGPYFSDFESNALDFGVNHVSGTQWVYGNPIGLGTVTPSNAWATGLTNVDYVNDSESYLYSPNFNFSTAGTYNLDFYTRVLAENTYDGMIVEYSLNKGSTWTKLGSTINATWYNANCDASVTIFTPSTPIFTGTTGTLATGYATRSYNVSSLAGNANVAFRFVFKSDGSVTARGIGIDNFNLTAPSAALNADFTASTTTVCQNQALTFTSTSTGTISSYAWNFGSGASPATANTAGPHTVTYLTSGTKTVSLSLNAGASVNTKTNYITVNPLVTPSVTIALTSGNNPSCAGNSVTFTATPVNGGSTPSYQWKEGAVNVGTNAATYTTTGLLNGTSVTCVLTSNACTSNPVATSNAINMTVNPILTPALSIALTSGANPSCAGSPLTFTATPTNGGAAPTFVWKQGAATVGTNSSSFTSSAIPNGSSITCILTSNAVCASPTTSTSNAIVVNTVTAAGTSTLLTPSNAATGQVLSPSFTWSSVANADSYQIDIASDIAFSSIVQSATSLLTNAYTAAPALNISTTYYWRVRAVNACGVGANSSTFSFTTSANNCVNVASTAVPILITSVGTPSVTSTVPIALPANATITGVTVTNLVGTHTYISDLVFILTSPTGTNVTLMSGLCTSLDNFNINFSASGAAYATIPCPPTSGGTFQPSGALSAFNGQNPNGTWTLTINDLFDVDGGELTSWSLGICYSTPTCPTITGSTSVTNVLCNSATSGSINLTPSGGTAPYTFLWSNGATTEDISGLAAGAYTVSIRDVNACSGNVSATISQPTALTATSTKTDVLCFGNSSGSINLTPNGGSTPYTFNWGGGILSEDRSSLAAGTYQVTITDTYGCTYIHSATINQPASALTITKSIGNVLCFGGSSGAITITAIGGTSAYSYNWGGGIISKDRSGLPTGTYNLTVTDANGCTATNSTAITQPASALTSSKTSSNVLCNGTNTGTINLSPVGGTLGYAFIWSDGVTTEDRNSLMVGTYNVSITDANGCTNTNSAIISQPSAIGASSVIGPISCFGGTNGSINLTPSGGVAGYTFNWGGGIVTEDRTNIAVGTYNVTITDANNCSTTHAATLTQPSAITLTNSVNNALCFGASSGAINISVNGGTPTYTYKWSNGPSTEDINGLASGNYNITITDANACITTSTIFVGQASAINFSLASQTNVSCNGGNNASASMNTATGGTGPYTYDWNGNPIGDGTLSIVSLTAGTYSCTVTDAAGCLNAQSVSITEPSLISASITSTTTSCTVNTGTASLSSLAGGSPGYTFLWSNGRTTSSISGLAASNYTCSITDANNCMLMKSVTVLSAGGISLTSSSQNNVLCNGSNTGTATVNPATGGLAPYTYNWLPGTPAGDGTTSISALNAGTYTCVVTDANACSVSQIFIINEPSPISFTLNSTNHVTCPSGSNGSLSANIASGGIAPYTYDWNGNPTGDGTISINGLIAGNYSCTVTDANGCNKSIASVINQPNPIVINNINSNVLCKGQATGAIDLSVSGGTPAYTFNWGAGIISEDRTALSAGSYAATITDANNCKALFSTTISEPLLSLNSTCITTHVLCKGNANGAINLSVSGGTSPYVYVWTNTKTSEDISNLTAAAYSVNITDANGCSAMNSAILIEPASDLSINILSSNNPTSCGISNGSINMSTSGGTPSYTYRWSNNASTEDLTSAGVGNYNITVTDANGCQATNSMSLTGPSTPTVTLTLPITNFCTNGGFLSLSGGNPAGGTYSGQGVSGGLFNPANALPGVITISYTYTDANFCSATSDASFTLSVCQTVQVENSAKQASIFPNPSNGIFILESSEENNLVSIFDVTGKKVFEEKRNSSKDQIDVHFLADGVYTLNITSENYSKNVILLISKE